MNIIYISEMSSNIQKIIFLIISIFVDFLICLGLLSFLLAGKESGSSAVTAWFIVITFFWVWIIVSYLISKKITPVKINTLPQIQRVIYNESFKRKVKSFRNILNFGILLIFSSIIYVICIEKKILPEIPYLAPILFISGPFLMLGSIANYSWLGKISANEIMVYPFQFINDPEERKQAVLRKMRNELIGVTMITIVVLFLGVLDIIPLKSALFGALVGWSSIPHRRSQLQKLLNIVQ